MVWLRWQRELAPLRHPFLLQCKGRGNTFIILFPHHFPPSQMHRLLPMWGDHGAAVYKRLIALTCRESELSFDFILDIVEANLNKRP